MGDDGENTQDILKADNDFMVRMIDLIPPKFYFKQDQLSEALSGEDELEQSGKRKRGQELSEKSKIKRAKFDPSHVKTVSKIQGLVHAKESNDESRKGKKRTNLEADEVKSSTENLEDLRARIQEKIKSMKEKRKSLGKEDYMEKKRIKKKLGEMKKKMRKASQKQGAKGAQLKGAPLANGLGSPKHGPAKTGIVNSDGKLVFSKFDFSEAEKPSKKDGKPGRKNFKKLLEKVNQDKEKLEALKETDKEKAKKLVEKTAWQNALQKAQGIKVRDDPNMLKKSIKKQDQKKRKTQKEWQERDEKVEKKKQDRQDKRKKNIQAKKQSRIDQKVKKAKKKGRIIPGF